MKVVTITNDNFKEEVLNSSIPVLVDFNADWCGPCRMLKPILEELAREISDYKIASINVDNEEELAQEYGISSIPCLIVFKNGSEVKRNIGLVSKDRIQGIMEDI